MGQGRSYINFEKIKEGQQIQVKK